MPETKPIDLDGPIRISEAIDRLKCEPISAVITSFDGQKVIIAVGPDQAQPLAFGLTVGVRLARRSVMTPCLN